MYSAACYYVNRSDPRIQSTESSDTKQREFFYKWRQIYRSCDRLDDLILLSNAHALQRVLSYYLRFCVYVWTGENDSNALRVDANFFQKRRKKPSFSKISAYVWTGPKARFPLGEFVRATRSENKNSAT